jgi:hypothetical protein
MEAQSDPTRARVVVISATPLLGEAVAAEMRPHADVRVYPAGAGDTAGLLKWTAPDCIVVDTDGEAEQIEEYARDRRIVALHVVLGRHVVRVLRDDGWEQIDNPDDSPDLIRNVLVGGMFTTGGRGERG